jgi:hypothetical protein
MRQSGVAHVLHHGAGDGAALAGHQRRRDRPLGSRQHALHTRRYALAQSLDTAPKRIGSALADDDGFADGVTDAAQSLEPSVTDEIEISRQSGLWRRHQHTRHFDLIARFNIGRPPAAASDRQADFGRRGAGRKSLDHRVFDDDAIAALSFLDDANDADDPDQPGPLGDHRRRHQIGAKLGGTETDGGAERQNADYGDDLRIGAPSPGGEQTTQNDR